MVINDNNNNYSEKLEFVEFGQLRKTAMGQTLTNLNKKKSL